jgi:hypothetical protein
VSPIQQVAQDFDGWLNHIQEFSDAKIFVPKSIIAIHRDRLISGTMSKVIFLRKFR